MQGYIEIHSQLQALLCSGASELEVSERVLTAMTNAPTKQLPPLFHLLIDLPGICIAWLYHRSQRQGKDEIPGVGFIPPNILSKLII